MKYTSIVLNIPHSSTEGLSGSGWPTTAAFDKEVARWTDWFTDSLFSGIGLDNTLRGKVHEVIFPLSRFVVDAERLEHDPLESEGRGIIYRNFEDFSRKVEEHYANWLLSKYYEHQNALRAALQENSLLIDCHSFPSSLSDVDVCLGFNEDWSKPSMELVEKVADMFQGKGLKVGINEPYSNAISPSCGFKYHSLMIELNKRIYMDEEQISLLPESHVIHEMLINLYSNILYR